MDRYNRYNRYSILKEDDDEEYQLILPNKITHLELHPVALLIKYRNITHLEPHPTSHLIKFICIYHYILYKHKVRFNDTSYYMWEYKEQHRNPSYYITRRNDNAYHDDILLKSELDRIKEELNVSKKKLDDEKNIVYNRIDENNEKIYEIKNVCKTTCVKWLDQIHICKCGKCYACENTEGIDKFDLGRCRHYYEIERLKEENDYEEEIINEYTQKFWEIESRYKRELAKKNKSLNEYEREIDEEYEDWSFTESMRYCDYQRNYKEPKYVY
jgi:hypothetical protein